MSVEQLVETLRGLAGGDRDVIPTTDGRIFARCPACEAHGPNRTQLTVEIDGAVNCRRGCSLAAIVASSGIYLRRKVTEGPHRKVTSTTDLPIGALPTDDLPTLPQVPTLVRSPALDRHLTLSELATLGQDERVLAPVAELYGFEDPLATFPCPAPWHRGADAHFFRDDGPSGTGNWKVACSCPEAGRSNRFHSLAEMHAYLLGAKQKPGKLERVVFYRRLWRDAGVIELNPWPLPPLTEDASADLRRLREGFALLLTIRRLDDPKVAVAMTGRFGQLWTGVSEELIKPLRNDLAKRGILNKDGTTRGSSRTTLFIPGTEAPKEVGQ